MDKMAPGFERQPVLLRSGKFQDPKTTLTGEERAVVPLDAVRTLWINTGTQCNIACTNCYIESSPTNDRLAYITADEVSQYFDEIRQLNHPTTEIGFTGGEPFMNPYFLSMLDDALMRGFEVLILTNAMLPMQRSKIRAGLLELLDKYGQRLKLRISLDHYSKRLHDAERGSNSWDKAMQGLDWLVEHKFDISIAGRTCWNEDEDIAREGYRELFESRAYPIDVDNPAKLMLFPEMNANLDIAEITSKCWDILQIDPSEIMCASSRMIVKRKDADKPVVLPCTLLPYDTDFEMGNTLKESFEVDGGNFDNGGVRLNHPHCARFCVLGGGACSVSDD